MDILIFGATGFVGRQVAKRLDAGTTHRLGLAGRRSSALEGLAGSLDRAADIRVADSTDPASVAAAVEGAAVVIGCAGPFISYGDPVVEACLEHGADYVDITGETPWVRSLIDRFDDRARDAGLRIVPCCGFDSVPSDLGAMLVGETLASERSERLTELDAAFTIRGGINGGTLATMLQMAEGGHLRELADPMLLNPDSERTRELRRANPDPRSAVYNEDLERWLAPFVMGPINSRIVRRSDALKRATVNSDHGIFRYREWMSCRSRWQARQVTLGLGAVALASRSRPGRFLLTSFGPAPGEGPNAASRENGYFRSRLVGRSASGTRVRGEVSGPGDPGNVATTTMVCESALALLENRDQLPTDCGSGGILTPATALGQVLIERLRSTGYTLEAEIA